MKVSEIGQVRFVDVTRIHDIVIVTWRCMGSSVSAHVDIDASGSTGEPVMVFPGWWIDITLGTGRIQVSTEFDGTLAAGGPIFKTVAEFIVYAPEE